MVDKSSFVNSLSNTGVTLNSISKFGANSAYLGGQNTNITLPNSASFNLANGEFTVEALVYPTYLDSNPRYIISQVQDLSNNANRSWGLNISSNRIQWAFYLDGLNDQNINVSCNINVNSWLHIAVGYKNGTLYTHLDGN